jgi:hypothetical protein
MVRTGCEALEIARQGMCLRPDSVTLKGRHPR